MVLTLNPLYTGTFPAATALGISMFTLPTLSVVGDVYTTGNTFSSYAKLTTSTTQPGHRLFSLGPLRSDFELLEQASKMDIPVLSPKKPPVFFTPVYAFAPIAMSDEPLHTSEKNPHIKAMCAADKIADSTGDLDTLIRNLSAPNSSVRSETVYALGRRGDPNAIQPLIDMLGDTDDDLRKTVTIALQAVVDHLFDRLYDKKADPKVLLAAANGLEAVVDHLIPALNLNPNVKVRRAAAKILHKAVRALMSICAVYPPPKSLEDPDGFVWHTVARIQSRHDDSLWRSATEDKDREVRVNVFKAFNALNKQ